MYEVNCSWDGWVVKNSVLGSEEEHAVCEFGNRCDGLFLGLAFLFWELSCLALFSGAIPLFGQ